MVAVLLQAGAAKLLAAITDIYVDIDVPVLPPSPQSNLFFFFVPTIYFRLPPQMEKAGKEGVGMRWCLMCWSLPAQCVL